MVEDVSNKQYDLKTGTADTFKVCLTNTQPVVANTLLANIVQIASGNGYTTDGNVATHTSGAQTAGIFKLVLADPATWTGAGAGMAAFRFAVLYNVGTGKLMGWYDYASSISLGVGETFVCDLDQTNGVLTIQ
jgi:hypothetical protein